MQRCRKHGFDPWVGKIHWRKKRPPLQYSCLENSMDREAGWATAHVVSKSRIWLSTAVFCTMWDINLNISISIGFPAGSMVKNPPAKQEIWFNLWVRKIPLRKKWQLTPIFLPRKCHRQKNLVGHSPRGHERVRHDLTTKQKQQLLYSTGNAAQCSMMTKFEGNPKEKGYMHMQSWFTFSRN